MYTDYSPKRKLSFSLQQLKRWITIKVVILLIAGMYVATLVFQKLIDKAFAYRVKVLQPNFSYPLDVENFPDLVERYRSGDLNISPINLKYSNIDFIRNAIAPEDYKEPLGFLIVVKSATRNYEKRQSIRKTWGEASYLNRTLLSANLPTKLVFICGIPTDFVHGEELFLKEAKYNDIVLANFNDNYFNNTVKSVLVLRWAETEFPSSYKFLILVDDDVYLDLYQLRASVMYFAGEGEGRRVYKDLDPITFIPLASPEPTKFDNEGYPVLSRGLYMGRVYVSSEAQRIQVMGVMGLTHGGKWSVSLKEYPFNMYPPYIPGAGMVLSKRTVSDFYYASFFTDHLWIDDVYFGILAYKMDIYPLHNGHFLAGLDDAFTLNSTGLANAILIHGFRCPDQMVALWRDTNLINTLPSCCILGFGC